VGTLPMAVRVPSDGFTRKPARVLDVRSDPYRKRPSGVHVQVRPPTACLEVRGRALRLCFCLSCPRAAS
jgi:hypothetical protein